MEFGQVIVKVQSLANEAGLAYNAGQTDSAKARLGDLEQLLVHGNFAAEKVPSEDVEQPAETAGEKPGGITNVAETKASSEEKP